MIRFYLAISALVMREYCVCYGQFLEWISCKSHLLFLSHTHIRNGMAALNKLVCCWKWDVFTWPMSLWIRWRGGSAGQNSIGSSSGTLLGHSLFKGRWKWVRTGGRDERRRKEIRSNWEHATQLYFSLLHQCCLVKLV